MDPVLALPQVRLARPRPGAFELCQQFLCAFLGVATPSFPVCNFPRRIKCPFVIFFLFVSPWPSFFAGSILPCSFFSCFFKVKNSRPCSSLDRVDPNFVSTDPLRYFCPNLPRSLLPRTTVSEVHFPPHGVLRYDVTPFFADLPSPYAFFDALLTFFRKAAPFSFRSDPRRRLPFRFARTRVPFFPLVCFVREYLDLPGTFSGSSLPAPAIFLEKLLLVPD